MANTHIIRIPRSDEEGTFLIVQITPTGSKTLDLKLVATEGFSPFVVKLRHDRVSTLKAKNALCSEREWVQFLTAILRDREAIPDIEAVAHVVEEKEVTVTIRRRVQGITQRLGTFTLNHDDRQDIELFDWCSTALAAKEKAAADLASAASKANELESVATELRSQLEELIQAKQSDESQMLEKFRDLLNEKKVKIREQQQRLLVTSASSSDPQTTSARGAPSQAGGSTDEDTGTRRAPKASRPSKRKAAQAVDSDDSDDSDESLEKMEVDKKHGEEESEGQETPDPDETGSEPDGEADEDDDNDKHEDSDNQSQPAGRRGKGRMPAPSTRGQASSAGRAAGKEKAPPEAPPPKRSLPFGLGKSKSKPGSAPDPGSDTDDDEL